MQLPVSAIFSILVLHFGVFAAVTYASPAVAPSAPPPTRTVPASPSYFISSPKLKARDPDAHPDPQETCPNSGYGNSGCNNSGIDNTGTSNSGVNNCGTGKSGVGEGCDDADNNNNGVWSSATTATAAGGTFVVAAGVGTAGYTTTLTGPTNTVTIVGNGRNRRTDCAYWESQGYVCSGAAPALGKSWGFGIVALAVTVCASWVVMIV